MSFTKRIEDFTCEHCGAEVVGNGYTNHCPQCLWSRHVDVHPGDRAAPCKGMMEPVALQGSSPNYRIVHRCQRCGFERTNDIQIEDSEEALLQVAAQQSGG